MTATERLLSATPAWQADPPPEVVIRHRSGSVSSRRPYPVAKNDPFVPNRAFVPGFDLEGVGEGNDVYLEPDEDAEAGSEEAKNRIKRIRNIGGGSQVLVEQEEDDLENKLRSLRPKPGNLLSVEQLGETVDFGTTGVTGGAQINIDGRIDTVRGVVSNLVEGRRGGTGSLSYTRCDGSSSELIAWENGQITTNGIIIFEVGECGGGSTETPGP